MTALGLFQPVPTGSYWPRAVSRGVSAATLRQMAVQTEHMTTWIEPK